MSPTGQLTFDDIRVNPSVSAIDEDRLSAKAWEVYKLFRDGVVHTIDLIFPRGIICPYCCRWFRPFRGMHVNCQYNARVNEVRQVLRALGLTIDLVKEGEGGNNTYKIVRFEGSRYQEHLKETGRN